MKRLVIGLFLISLCSGCTGLGKLLEQQETTLLKAQIQQADETASILAANPDPEVGSQFSVFVPATVLNDLLNIASNQTFTMPGDFKDVTVRIDSIKTSFNQGLAYLSFAATACKTPPTPATGCADPEVTLSTSAYIGITDADIAGTGAAATFRVYVTDVVPNVKVGLFNFELRGFVKKLLKAGLTQFVQDNVPSLTVPLETKIPLRFPALDQALSIPTPRGGDSRLTGRLRSAGLNQDFVLKLKRPLFLRDGVRLYLAISQS